MIYQQIIAMLKVLNAKQSAYRYASDNAFDLQEKFDSGSTIDELVLICMLES